MKNKKYNWLLGLGLLFTTFMSTATIITSLADFNTQSTTAIATQLDTFDNNIAVDTQDSGVVSTLARRKPFFRDRY